MLGFACACQLSCPPACRRGEAWHARLRLRVPGTPKAVLASCYAACCAQPGIPNEEGGFARRCAPLGGFSRTRVSAASECSQGTLRNRALSPSERFPHLRGARSEPELVVAESRCD